MKKMKRGTGIVLMVTSVFLVAIMLLMMNWPSDLTIMQNLSTGSVFSISDILEKTCEGYKSKYIKMQQCTDGALYFKFKYMVIIPMVTFLIGLLGLQQGRGGLAR